MEEKNITIKFNGIEHSIPKQVYSVKELLDKLNIRLIQNGVLKQEHINKPELSKKYENNDEKIDFNDGLIFLYRPTSGPIS